MVTKEIKISTGKLNIIPIYQHWFKQWTQY